MREVLYNILIKFSYPTKAKIYFFKSNSVIYNSNTRHNNNLHLPHGSLSIYQKSVYYSGIKVFNNLPTNIKYLFYSKK